MAIYKDKETRIPVTSLAAFYATPLCTASTIDKDLLESFQQILYFTDGDSSTIPDPLLHLTGSPTPALKKLCQNGFTPGGISVSGNSTTGYSLNVSHPDRILVGPLSAALYMVVMFHLTKQLQLITCGTISTNSPTPKNDPERERRADFLDANQPVIYQVLKQVLINNGFKNPGTKPSDTLKRVAFNDLLMPNLFFGGKMANNPSAIKGKLFYYMVKEALPPPLDYRPDENHFIFKDPSVTTYYKSIPYTHALQVYLENEINKVIFNIFTAWNVQKKLIIQKDVKCLFNSILPNKSLPDGMIIGAGDGSMTKGILCKENYGLLFLEYDFEFVPFNGFQSVKPKGGKISSFKSPEPGNRTTVHLDVYGLNGDISHVAVNVNGYGCYFIASENPNPALYNASIPTPFNPPASTFNDINAYFPALKTYVIPGPAAGEYYFIDSPTAPYKIVATYKTSIQELIFTSEGTDVKIISYSPVEDVAVIANVVQDIVEQFSFVVENLFGDDRFELTTYQKENVFLQPASNYDSKLDKIVDILNTATANFTSTIILNGAFVGKLAAGIATPDLPTVIKDPDYTLFRNITTKIEDYFPSALGSDDEILYSKLRYSFGTITYAPDKLEITIDSYVNPLRSRLDKRLLGPNLNGTGNPEDLDNPFDYRDYTTFNLPRFNTELNPQTWYGANQSSEAYLLTNESLPESATNPKIASYNQLLSSLRCFGVLEALVYRINARAALQGSTVATKIANKLNDIITSVTCETIKTGGIKTNPPVYLSNANYEALKWYTSAIDKSLY